MPPKRPRLTEADILQDEELAARILKAADETTGPPVTREVFMRRLARNVKRLAKKSDGKPV